VIVNGQSESNHFPREIIIKLIRGRQIEHQGFKISV
jgi:hypothetical protein